MSKAIHDYQELVQERQAAARVLANTPKMKRRYSRVFDDELLCLMLQAYWYKSNKWLCENNGLIVMTEKTMGRLIIKHQKKCRKHDQGVVLPGQFQARKYFKGRGLERVLVKVAMAPLKDLNDHDLALIKMQNEVFEQIPNLGPKGVVQLLAGLGRWMVQRRV